MSERFPTLVLVDHFGSLLLSRADGARAREMVRSLQTEAGRVRVDFGDIEVIAPGFADEFFGRLPSELFEKGLIEVDSLSTRFASLQRLVTRASPFHEAAPAA